ncbi:hypothetical protein [Streptomyces sp. NPDC006134]|uniref:hypothetical protein n=1 Tax=Streptomyces sp. NPDC006134 TaxID=3154467 RepID=UPI0033CBE1CC
MTGYVRRVRVDGRCLYAKYSVLGVSLVSLLRGACGPWPDVRARQQAYVCRADALMEREATQLRLLAGFGCPQVCSVAGLRRGVLFTESVTGPTLAGLILDRPHETAALLDGTFGELRRLHSPDASRLLVPATGERSVRGTFQRKFNGLRGSAYVDRLGVDRCLPDDRPVMVGLLRSVVGRLRRLQAAGLPSATQCVPVYGDLKPEHVVFPAGPPGRPVFLDPGLLPATPVVDAAKLISRTVLMLAAARPGLANGERAVDGVSAFVTARTGALPRCIRQAWLQELMVLWLMDTVNILTTYLSAPPVLPLPAQGLALVGRTLDLCRVVEQIGAELSAGADARTVWDISLDLAQGLAV